MAEEVLERWEIRALEGKNLKRHFDENRLQYVNMAKGFCKVMKEEENEVGKPLLARIMGAYLSGDEEILNILGNRGTDVNNIQDILKWTMKLAKFIIYDGWKEIAC